jgi:hypothetical protein
MVAAARRLRDRRLLIALLATLLATLVATLLWAPQSSFALASNAVRQPSEVIYVVRRGWHIDIGFAVAELGPSLQSVSARFPGARYVFFGFGDKHYLLAKNRNGPVLLGALWPGPGMILATALDSTPQAAFGQAHVIALGVAPVQVQAAQAFIWRSLTHHDDAVVPYGEGPYEGSLFFAAMQKYSAFHTCNTWAAEALKAAQLPIRSVGVIFAGQLWGPVRRLSHRRASLPSTNQ